MKANETFEKLMGDAKFLHVLDNVENYDALRASFSAEGVDIDEILTQESSALTEDELETVTGGAGINYNRLFHLGMTLLRKPPPWLMRKYGANVRVLTHAFYDLRVYGNPTRTYPESAVIGAAKGIGVNIE